MEDGIEVDTEEVEKDIDSENKRNNEGRMAVEVKAHTKDEVGADRKRRG